MLAFNHLGHLGRLGNQMFQYASLRGIAARRGYDFGIPPSKFEDEWRSHQLFELFDLPNLPRSNVKYLDGGNAPIAQERFFHFDQLLFDQCPNDISLFGYFQSEKYFKHIEDSIREDFVFRDHILEPCKEIAEGFDNPVSLHVRFAPVDLVLFLSNVDRSARLSNICPCNENNRLNLPTYRDWETDRKSVV